MHLGLSVIYIILFKKEKVDGALQARANEWMLSVPFG
jgi:hypothetical protein